MIRYVYSSYMQSISCEEIIGKIKAKRHGTIIVANAQGDGNLVADFFLTLLFALPLGMLVVRGRMAKNVVVSGLVNIYIMIMRGLL